MVRKTASLSLRVASNYGWIKWEFLLLWRQTMLVIFQYLGLQSSSFIIYHESLVNGLKIPSNSLSILAIDAG